MDDDRPVTESTATEPQETTLRGRTIGITAERKATEIGAAFERRGARVRYGAAMHTVPLPEDGELAEATEAVLARPVQHVVAITGMGFRGWFEAAEHRGLRERLAAHLAGANVLARGAKACGAVRAAGLRESWTSPNEESGEVLHHLLQAGVAGERIAVQLHGDPMWTFRERLAEAGAEVVAVPVYRWTDPVDLDALDRLIGEVIAGGIDALPFTSAPAAANLLRRAERIGNRVELDAALRQRVLLACVGPVTAAPIAEAGVPHVTPQRSRTAALVKLVAEHLGENAQGGQ